APAQLGEQPPRCAGRAQRRAPPEKGTHSPRRAGHPQPQTSTPSPPKSSGHPAAPTPAPRGKGGPQGLESGVRTRTHPQGHGHPRLRCNVNPPLEQREHPRCPGNRHPGVTGAIAKGPVPPTREGVGDRWS
uniref:Uncharacterized protein n=1 Tax=Oryzias sinensis TaxID=183150 RepID=A0A8C7WY80_9TELE